MPRHRLVIIAIVALLAIMATIHFTINGLPSLASFNPHAN